MLGTWAGTYFFKERQTKEISLKPSPRKALYQKSQSKFKQVFQTHSYCGIPGVPIMRTFINRTNLEIVCLACRSGPNLDRNSVGPLDPPLFYENYAKLYFDLKRKKTGLNRGGKSCSTLFSGVVPFLANIGCCPNFLNQAL